MRVTKTSIEARPLIKIFAGILQIAGAIMLFAGILNFFVPLGLPGWAVYAGLGFFLIGMLFGTRATSFRQ